MTSDGISSEDWCRVRELAVAVVNADDDNGHRDRLIEFLQSLIAKYGERPSLLATQADYADDQRESERLLLRAFDLALGSADLVNIREISLSLADLYASELRQLDHARQWLEIAREYVRPDSEADAVEYQRIRNSIEDRS